MVLSCFSPKPDDPERPDPFTKLSGHESRWVELQPFLLHRGYQLRPRYQPSWEPSWRKPRFFGRRDRWDCEDSIRSQHSGIIDAVRLSDGAKVVIKEFSTTRPELPLLQKLSKPEMRNDPRNRTVPVLDLFMAPDTDETALVVMPRLMELLDIPFQFVVEVFDAFRQYLETMAFLHEHHIAHMDACSGNLMMDVSKLVPSGFHFSRQRSQEKDINKDIKYKSRREAGPMNYYIIDFGISQDLSPTSGQFGRKFYPRWGQDKTIPEWKDVDTQHDPFKVDVCQLGNVFKRLVTHYEGLSALQSLVDDMTFWDPNVRPTAVTACTRLAEITSSLKPTELEQRIFMRAASKNVRRRLVKGKSPSELVRCDRFLFPEWYARSTSSEKTVVDGGPS